MSPRQRALIAFFLHAPGLRLFTPGPLPPGILRPNLLAAGLTAIAVALLATQSWWAALAAWLIGHTLWGLWLARRTLPVTH
jgi:hypothetical protein